MSSLARGRVDDLPIHVGDTVMIAGEVLQSVAGVGALVRLFSKTDEMQVWVAEHHLRWAQVQDSLPPEPVDGTWLLVDGSLNPDGNPQVFCRDDAEGHYDERRRHQQRWFDVVAQEWLDWPQAVSRGAARTGVRRMTVDGDSA